MRDDGTITSSLGDDGLRRIVAGIQVHVWQGSQQDIRPGEPRISCRCANTVSATTYRIVLYGALSNTADVGVTGGGPSA